MACSSSASQYSPFFTSGLLSSPFQSDVLTKPTRRRPSLTINTMALAPQKSAVESSLSDAGCSFLTLETEEPSKQRRQVRKAAASSSLPPSAIVSPTPSRKSDPSSHHQSRERFSLPSAKPPPSASLPAIPRKRTHRPETLVFFPESDQAGSSHRPLRCSKGAVSSPAPASPPSCLPEDSQSFDAISPQPVPPLVGLSWVSSKPASSPSAYQSKTSVPPSVIQHNRSTSLSALEGRFSRGRPVFTRSTRSFINMTDEEDDLLELADKRCPMLNIHLDEDTEDEDEDDDMFPFPESAVLPHFTVPWESSPTSLEQAFVQAPYDESEKRKSIALSYTSSLISFIDFEDGVDTMMSSSRSSMVDLSSHYIYENSQQ
ncbi:hypothetical protein BC835DRAFT_731068 [Cytidiella melzeri]|nr:hypothetical protein BC835DRAFT_731068 [Cytidiella melzeri]